MLRCEIVVAAMYSGGLLGFSAVRFIYYIRGADLTLKLFRENVLNNFEHYYIQEKKHRNAHPLV